MKESRLLFLFLLIFFVFSTCGKDETQTGSATFRLVWPDESQAKTNLEQPSPAAPTKQSFTIDDVVTIRVSVREGGITGADLITPVDFPYSDHQGTVHNIPAGTDRAFVVDGLNSSETVIFTGSATGITIEAGKTTDVGEIVMASCDAD
ncbi:MAG: hypothetical protein JSU92_03275, partial [Deltaproteobacteria bacterium]